MLLALASFAIHWLNWAHDHIIVMRFDECGIACSFLWPPQIAQSVHAAIATSLFTVQRCLFRFVTGMARDFRALRISNE